jgi:hypothetical protein
MGLLVVLVGVLAVLQYRWIGEISQAERQRLREDLKTAVRGVSRDFNAEITSACAKLLPTASEVEAKGRAAAYQDRYTQWQASTAHSRMFSRIAEVCHGLRPTT